MAKKPKPRSELEPWQETCWTCGNFVFRKYLHEGKYEGNCRMFCHFHPDKTMPLDVDNCEHYKRGQYTTENIEKGKKEAK